MPAISCVPLRRASPSLAPSSSGARPAALRASAPDIGPAGVSAVPSPISTAARWARGARSPLAPTLPRDGMTGWTDSLSMPHSSSASCGRTPERPIARALARSRSIARTTSTGKWLADTRGVRPDEVALELRHLLRLDPNVGEVAEAGGHAVDRLALGDEPLDHRSRGTHPVGGLGVERHLASLACDRRHVCDCQVAPVRRSGWVGAACVARLLSIGAAAGLGTPGEAGEPSLYYAACDEPRIPRAVPIAAAEAPDPDGSAVPSPAFAFLLALIALPSLFWLVTLKRTTDHTDPRGMADDERGPADPALGHDQRSAARRAAGRDQRPRLRLVRGTRLRGRRPGRAVAAAPTWPCCSPPGRWPSRSSGRSSTSPADPRDQPGEARERPLQRQRHRAR